MQTKLTQRDEGSSSTAAGRDEAQEAEQGTALDDARPDGVAQRRRVETANASPRLDQQRMAAHAVQRKTDDAAVAPNRTGLPDQLKAGIESLSGISMDGVKVHYNSAQPAQLHAHAFAQGKDIHVGPGQERHLPHEAWHIVQQAEGRVNSSRYVNKSVSINDDENLESEADEMGVQALKVGGNLVAASMFGNNRNISRSLNYSPKNHNEITHAYNKPIQRNIFKNAAKLFSAAKSWVTPNVAAEKEIFRQGTIVWRADKRPYSQISGTGFEPRSEYLVNTPVVTKAHLTNYQRNNASNPGVISAADEDGAKNFVNEKSPGTKMYLYRIDAGGLQHYPVSKNINWFHRIFYSNQNEVMLVGAIPPKLIKFDSVYTARSSEPPGY